MYPVKFDIATKKTIDKVELSLVAETLEIVNEVYRKIIRNEKGVGFRIF